MRKIHRLLTRGALGLGLIGVALLFSSCPGLKFDSAPTVALSLSASTVNSGATFTATATANDVDGDALTYSWYVNDVAQSATGATFSSAYVEHVADSTYTIKVYVSDGTLSASASTNLTVKTDNTAPSVTLDSNKTTVYSDQTFTLTATATDAENDSLSYTWYLDDTLQTVTASTTGAYFLEKTSDAYHTVRVEVSDAYHTTSASKSIYVYATGSLHIVNADTLPLTSLYIRENGTTDWGLNQLDNNIAVGATFIFYGISPNYYDTYIYDSGSYGYPENNHYYYAGTPHTWTIANTVAGTTFANRKGLNLGSTFTDGSEITATAGTRDDSVICIDASKR
jgi:hypothetical protein